MKKRLLKDLPFDNLKKDDVLYKVNGSYQIDHGETFYKGGGSSHNGVTILNTSSKDIIDMIWDKEDWFEEAILDHISVIPKGTELVIKFTPLCQEDSIYFAKGIIHILPHLEDGSYVWNKFKGITTSIDNRWIDWELL